MINFYRRFVQNSANTLMPLYDLLAEHKKLPKNAMINWTIEQEQAFNKSKNDLAQLHFSHTLHLMQIYSSLLTLQTLQ